jgi:hypothetical protein
VTRAYVGGGRDYNNYARIEAVLRTLGITELGTGAARGADLLTETWARRNEIDYRGYPAQWHKYGNRAGPIRNRHGLMSFAGDLVVALPGGTGTANMIRTARELGYTDDQLLVVTE